MKFALDPNQVADAAKVLSSRIGERFPFSGLADVCRSLVTTASNAEATAKKIGSPNWGFRLAVGSLSMLAFVGACIAMSKLEIRHDLGGISDFVQGVQSLIQVLVYVGATIYFVMGLELRRKRARVLTALHELRSFAHVIDMHQLTKDPERLRHEGKDTMSSPKRGLNRFELGRYLIYCSEMLSLVGKLSAVYVQNFPDPQAVDAAGDIEDLVLGLSQKVWHKLGILKTPEKA